MLWFLPSKEIQGQDAVFSQFYANSVYLNPAFAGSHLCSRAVLNYRNQWPKFPKSYISYAASMDTYAEKLHGGIAFMAVSDRLGGDLMTTNRYSAVYSYQMKLNYETRLNAGFELTYHQQTYNGKQLVFPDMIDTWSGTISNGGADAAYLGSYSEVKPDFSFGLLMFYRERYYFGLSTHHLTQPELHYFNTGDPVKLSRRWTFHGGAAIQLVNPQLSRAREEWTLFPSAMLVVQNDAIQTNLGMYLERNPMTLGVWYRHNIINHDAMVFLAGWRYRSFKFAYNYDLTLSALQNLSGGAHEISITFLFNCRKKNQFDSTINCPEF